MKSGGKEMGVKEQKYYKVIFKKAVIGSILALSLFAATARADIVIISHKNVSETALSKDYVQDIFLGKRVQWQDNSTIHVFVLKDPDIHEQFLKQFIHKSESQWKAYWKRMVFTGRGLPPKSINTEAELIDVVGKTAGAIGYVSTEGLPEDAESDSVKILKTER